MDLPIVLASALGLAVMSATGMVDPTPASGNPEGPAALVGERLYATEDPVVRWGLPSRAEDLVLRDMGRVEKVVLSPDGRVAGVVVAVGGLWGWGSQPVEVGPQRLRLVADAEGGQVLVVDLSVAGGEPPPDTGPLLLDL